MKGYIKKAMKLLDEKASEKKSGGPAKRALKHEKTPLRTPADLLRALRANKKALATFERFTASQKREYVSWITEAKTEETRERRLETAVDWMAEGKTRNWKYKR